MQQKLIISQNVIEGFIKKFLSGKLDELAAFDVVIRTRTIQLKQLLGGIWLSEWLNHVNDYLYKGNTQKAFMYAGHDLTIAYILAALDNFDNKIPSYSSTLMFELHEEGNEHFVQIHYKNKNNVRTFKLPGCEIKLCPLESFKNSIMHLLPEDIETLCGNK